MAAFALVAPHQSPPEYTPTPVIPHAAASYSIALPRSSFLRLGRKSGSIRRSFMRRSYAPLNANFPSIRAADDLRSPPFPSRLGRGRREGAIRASYKFANLFARGRSHFRTNERNERCKDGGRNGADWRGKDGGRWRRKKRGERQVA